MLFENYIYTLEMDSPGNQHCANCIDTLPFPIPVTMLLAGHYSKLNKLPRDFLKNMY